MAVALHSYLHFTGEAREALAFYESIFGGKAEMATFADYHMPVPEEEQQHIMHGYLAGDDGIALMASDAPSSMVQSSGSGNVTLALSGDDESKLRGYWESLSDGANITAPLETSPWGDTFGMLTDRFGIEWMVNITVDTKR